MTKKVSCYKGSNFWKKFLFEIVQVKFPGTQKTNTFEQGAAQKFLKEKWGGGGGREVGKNSEIRKCNEIFTI